ncbi:MAG: family 78 glycoside hydrolase catalytic domain [Candidatus Hydrogenedentota bacterium]
MLRFVLLLLACSLLTMPCALAQEAPRATRLTCEYRANPIGVDTEAPRFSWVFHSDRTGATQTAYQILVALAAEQLDAQEGALWDSGKVDSGETVLAPYAGEPLPEDRRCYWQVRVWDDAGTPSQWSARAHFTTGIAKKGGALESSQFTYVGMNPEEGNPEFPWLRHTLSIDNLVGVLAVRLHVNSLGFHEVWVNDRRIEQGPLMPAPSQFDKRSFYITHDITPYVNKGENVIGLWLGQGWYFPGLPGVVHEGPLAGAIVEVVTADGARTLPLDAEGWKAHPSNIRRIGEWRSGRYGGERVDSRDYPPGWSAPGFDDRGWAQAVVADVPEHTVTAQEAEPNRVVRTFAPKHVTYDGEGTWLVDFGTNLAGWFVMTFENLEPGQRVHMEFGDQLDGRELKTFSQQSVYIGRGEPGEFFRNKFNYHAFRYVRIQGIEERPDPESMSASLIRTDHPVFASFACSNPLLNDIHNMVHYTLECLSLGAYLVDCPHIERLGYGGDGQASTPTALTLFNMGALYTTWMNHWRDCQRPDGGLPHTAPNPYQAGGGPYWCAFSIAAPWHMYVHYNDVRALETNYPMMQLWLDGYVADNARDDGLLFGWKEEDYRNWYLGDWARPKRDEGDLERSTHLVNNCVIVQCHDRMAKIAKVLGKEEDAERYARQTEELRKKVHAEFWHDGTYADDTQIDLAYPLLVGVVPDDLEEAVEERLAKHILEENDGHLVAGLVGVPIVTTALLERGRSDVVFAYLNQRDFPSYGHMLESGATTTWEHWGGDRSHIHNCYNAVGMWFYRALAGIRPIEDAPAFKRFVLKPELVGDITWVNARQDTLRGAIESAWEIKDGAFHWRIAVPANTTAEVYVPAKSKEDVAADGLSFLRMEDGRAVFEAGGGEYKIEAAM